MKKYVILTAALLFSTSALANNIGDTQVVGSGVGIQGNGNNHNVINNGAGSGSTNNTNTNKNYNNSSASAKQHQSQYQSQSAHSSSKVNESGNSSNSYVNKNPVSTATAAALVASSETCMGSTSAGGQGVGFGISVGSTWHDEQCERRKNAGALAAFGKSDAALALLCRNDGVADAMAEAGTPCNVKVAKPTILSKLSPASGNVVSNNYPANRPRFE